MGTHMWTNGPARRGRRMTLELPPNYPFLQRRLDLFHPFLSTFSGSPDANSLQANVSHN